MEITDEFIELVENVLRVVNEYNQIQKLPLKFPNNVTLSTGAIHLIEAIKKHPNFNGTQLAEVLGVTKGAVSQQIQTLEKKSLVHKYQNKDNKKEIFYELSDLGQMCFDYHQEIHKELYENLAHDLSILSGEDMDLVNTMITRVSKSIKSYQNELRLVDNE